MGPSLLVWLQISGEFRGPRLGHYSRRDGKVPGEARGGTHGAARAGPLVEAQAGTPATWAWAGARGDGLPEGWVAVTARKCAAWAVLRSFAPAGQARPDGPRRVVAIRSSVPAVRDPVGGFPRSPHGEFRYGAGLPWCVPAGCLRFDAGHPRGCPVLGPLGGSPWPAAGGRCPDPRSDSGCDPRRECAHGPPWPARSWSAHWPVLDPGG